MKRKTLSYILILTMLLTAFAVIPVSASQTQPVDPIAVDISSRLKDKAAPQQPSVAEGAIIAAAGDTTASQCFGDDSTLTITISSFDPANPGEQDVVFFKETAPTATGNATLWVAWDFLSTNYGRQDVITCEQLEYLQSMMDQIVATDVKYFGDYVERPAGNKNIDVMIYNIVDESYFDAAYPIYIAGFFWSSINELFTRNMIFIDSLDWENRLGPTARVPYLYEGTVAHELEHLIHNDRDFDELSWVDEGMADLAEYLNGFGHPDGHVVYYMAYHRTPLTIWGGGLESYGASYLFQLYLLENFGTMTDGLWDPDWTRALIDTQANSIEGIEEATGALFEDLYDTWIMANYVDDPELVGQGGFPLGYDEIDLAPYMSPRYGAWSIERGIKDIYGADHHGNLPISRYYGGYISGTVEWPVGAIAPYAAVYGTYKGIQPQMNINLRGAAQSGVAPHTGTWEAASGGGNSASKFLELNMPVGGTLTFWTWFDIEEEWDYGFVEASTDNGATWEPLTGSITRTSTNPNNSSAWAASLVAGQASTDAAITGNSGGWVEATFTLPAASGVIVRFAYYTDEAVNGQGWFVDDVVVDGFEDGFEVDGLNWLWDGWSRTTGLFQNDWLAAYINPVYNVGKFDHLDYGFIDNDLLIGAFEYEIGLVNTSRLLKNPAVVVFSNRPTEESAFDANYRLFVNK